MLSLTCSLIFNNLGCHVAEKHPLNLIWLVPAKGALRFSVSLSKRMVHKKPGVFLLAKIWPLSDTSKLHRARHKIQNYKNFMEAYSLCKRFQILNGHTGRYAMCYCWLLSQSSSALFSGYLAPSIISLRLL